MRIVAALALLVALAGIAHAQPRLDDSLVVPFVTQSGQAALRQYRLAPEPKIFVVSPSGVAVWRQEATLELAREAALTTCARLARIACRPFAENERLVWDGPLDIDAQQAFARAHNADARIPSRLPAETTERNAAPVEDPARAPIHGATPATLPGGKVLATAALRDALAGARPPVLVEVSSSRGDRIATIPGATWIDKAGTGAWQADDGSPEARAFVEAMARAAPDRARPVVFTCDSATCWQAYRAALRALALGYRDVAWYRGGVRAWTTAGLALAQVPLFASVYDAAQDSALVDRQLAALRAAAQDRPRGPAPDEIRRWRVYLLAAHDREPVFHLAIDRIAGLLAASGVARADIGWLSAATREPSRLPTPENVDALFAPHAPARGEGCFVYMTSHGDDKGIEVAIARETWTLSPARLGSLLDRSCGAAPTVVVVSACYSGVFVDPAVLAPNRILLTAARRDRASFGCSNDFDFSFYDGCFIENFRGAGGWSRLAEAVIDCVRTRETANRMEPRSLPTASFGAQARNLPMVGARPAPPPPPRRPPATKPAAPKPPGGEG